MNRNRQGTYYIHICKNCVCVCVCFICWTSYSSHIAQGTFTRKWDTSFTTLFNWWHNKQHNKNSFQDMSAKMLIFFQILLNMCIFANTPTKKKGGRGGGWLLIWWVFAVIFEPLSRWVSCAKICIRHNCRSAKSMPSLCPIPWSGVPLDETVSCWNSTVSHSGDCYSTWHCIREFFKDFETQAWLHKSLRSVQE